MTDRRYPIQVFNPQRFGGFFGKDTKHLSERLLTGGACNSNYLVETPSGERYVCRLHQRSNPALEQMLTAAVADRVPCPDYLWIDGDVSVQTYIEGQHFEPTETLMRQAGRLIGQLSQHTFPTKGELKLDGSIRPFTNWDSLENGLRNLLSAPTVQTHLGKTLTKRTEHLLDRESERLASLDVCSNLVHGDFRPDNILTANDSIVGLVDWEFAHSGCSYMDIGNLMRHVAPKWFAPLAAGLTETGFELPEDWHYRAALIDLSSHLEFLTSNRSDVFKQQCVQRVEALLALKPSA